MVRKGMAIKIDQELIEYLEDLSYLTLSQKEKQRLTGDLQEILERMTLLAALDTEGVCERSHRFGGVNALREDEVRPSFNRELILRNAPHRNKEMFMMPKAVE